MKFKDYLKGKRSYTVIHLIILVLTGILLYLQSFNVYIGGLILLVYLLGSILGLCVEFLAKRNYYHAVKTYLDKLNSNGLSSELIEVPSFVEGKVLYEALKTTNKAMNDEMVSYQSAVEDDRAYIERWAREIKMPISSAKRMIENHKSSITLLLGEEFDKVGWLVEQALFCWQSNSVKRVCTIKRTLLRELVNSVIRKNAKTFIGGKINLETNDLAHTVDTDVKWTDFIIGQLIYNAIECKNNDCTIKIYGASTQNYTILYIEDNGQGIPADQIKDIFDPPHNAQDTEPTQSVRTGLYLCKKMCDELGVSISIQSTPNVSTIVELHFPIAS